MNESLKSPPDSKSTQSSTLPLPKAGGAPESLPEHKKDFRRELSRSIDQLRGEIDSLKAKAKVATRRHRAEYLELMEAVERKATRLQRSTDKFFAGAGGGWESFRTGAESTWKDLRISISKVALSLRERHPKTEGDTEDKAPRN